MLTRLKKASVDTGYSVVSIIRSAIEAYLKGMGL
jgi:predicted DNA-binding protein